MSNPDFEARLARLRQTEQGEIRDARRQTGPSHRPARSYRDRLDRALAHAAAAGISRDAGFPPAMRALSALGLPIRPLHFKTIPSLFLIGLCLGLGVFGGTLWLFTSGLIDPPGRGPIAGVVDLGWPGVAVVSVCIGVAFATIIRAQAARARLPGWQDL